MPQILGESQGPLSILPPTCCPETYLFLINLQSTEENDLGVILSSVCNFIVIACGTKTIVVRMRGNFKQL